jgi:hypothetical protein
MMEQAAEVVDYVTRAGLGVILIVLIWGGAKGHWVYKREVDALTKDRDHWKTQADELLTLVVQQEIHDAERSRD